MERYRFYVREVVFLGRFNVFLINTVRLSSCGHLIGRRFYRLRLFRVGGVSLWSLGGVFRGFILVIVSIRLAFGLVGGWWSGVWVGGCLFIIPMKICALGCGIINI